jgi:hypothetical protein
MTFEQTEKSSHGDTDTIEDAAHLLLQASKPNADCKLPPTTPVNATHRSFLGKYEVTVQHAQSRSILHFLFDENTSILLHVYVYIKTLLHLLFMNL